MVVIMQMMIVLSFKKDHGCMDPLAFNYNFNATEDNGSCYPKIYGCVDIIMLLIMLSK